MDIIKTTPVKYIGIAMTILILYLSYNYMIRENTYIISIDTNGNITAKNQNGTIEFSGKDVSDILSSINNVMPRKGIIKIKEGIYTPLKPIIFTKSVELKAEGDVIFNWNMTDTTSFLFSFIGSEIITTSFTKDVRENTNSITIDNISSNSTLSYIINDDLVGDLLLIYDNNIWNPIDYPEWKTGELHEIESISGNNIIISDNTINYFSTNKSGNIKLIRPITVKINGITIKGPGNTYSCRGIYLRYNKNSLIQNSNFQKCGREEIVIGDSYRVTAENNNIGDNLYVGFGYGIVVADSSAYTNITNNYLYNSRHAITVGGLQEEIGQARETTVSFNTFADNTGIQAVIDAHPIAESYYIYNNTIYSPPLQGAIVSGARITKIKGNKIIGGLGIYTYATTKSPGFIIEITDNVMNNSRRIFNNENDNMYDNIYIYYIDIENNIITGDAIWSITALYNVINFNVSGNQFNSVNKGIGQWGIYVNNSKNGIISNNTINNSYYSGLKLDSTDNTNISNNDITYYNNYGDLGEKGILLKDSSNNTIVNNMLKRSGDIGTYGITETGESDYNMIFDNNLRQVGTINSNRIQTIGNNTKLKNNRGYETVEEKNEKI